MHHALELGVRQHLHAGVVRRRRDRARSSRRCGRRPNRRGRASPRRPSACRRRCRRSARLRSTAARSSGPSSPSSVSQVRTGRRPSRLARVIGRDLAKAGLLADGCVHAAGDAVARADSCRHARCRRSRSSSVVACGIASRIRRERVLGQQAGQRAVLLLDQPALRRRRVLVDAGKLRAPRELQIEIWPQARTSITGLFGRRRGRVPRDRDGGRYRAWSGRSRARRIHSPGWSVAARAAIAPSSASSVGAVCRLGIDPADASCRARPDADAKSLRPGVASRPSRSMTRVFGPIERSDLVRRSGRQHLALPDRQRLDDAVLAPAPDRAVAQNDIGLQKLPC